MGSGPNWYQIWNKAYYISKINKFYTEKGYPCQQAYKCHLWHVKVYSTDQNVMQRGDPKELNSVDLETQK